MKMEIETTRNFGSKIPPKKKKKGRILPSKRPIRRRRSPSTDSEDAPMPLWNQWAHERELKKAEKKG